MRHVRMFSMAAGLALIASSAAHAQVVYKIQSIAKLGDTLAGVKTKTAEVSGDWEIGALNDNGQMVLVTEDADGGEVLLQYSGGQFIPIMVPGKSAPGGGVWSSADGNGPLSPISMNQAGNIAFSANVTINGATVVNTFLWDAKAQQVTAVALAGAPAVNNLTFQTAGDFSPVINGSNQIAFPAGVTNSTGAASDGLFFYGPGGKLQAIMLPDQVLPDGSKVGTSGNPFPSLNDQGAVAFRVRRVGDGNNYSAYLWSQGTITPLALAGSTAPGGATFSSIGFERLNNKDNSVLILARAPSSSPAGIYRYKDGKLTALVVPGQAMPGGGKFAGLQQDSSGLYPYYLSFANANGQFAFEADLDDGSTAAYLLDLDGTVSLILKSGTMTELGPISKIGEAGTGSFGLGLNGKGQVALVATISQGQAGVSEPTIVVLSPVGP